MYAINRNGDKMPVDDSNVDYSNGGNHPYVQSVALVSDDVYLKPIWILQVQRDKNAHERGGIELELIEEIKFRHEPTDEEIIYAMASHDLGLYQIATIVKGYEMDAHYDD